MRVEILLIEQSPEYARAFRQSIRAMVDDPDKVNIRWIRNVNEALHYLGSDEAHDIDQIWIEQTIVAKNHFEKLIGILEKHAPKCVYVLFQGVPISSADQQFTNSHNYIAALIADALKRKSSGTTVRVENALLQGKVEANEYRIQQLEGVLKELRDEVRSFATAHDTRLDRIESQASADAAKATASIERIKGRQLIVQGSIAAIATISTGIGVALVSNLDKLEKFFHFGK